jgi:hypothetical protein
VIAQAQTARSISPGEVDQPRGKGDCPQPAGVSKTESVRTTDRPDAFSDRNRLAVIAER